jgi:hypothetical protein
MVPLNEGYETNVIYFRLLMTLMLDWSVETLDGETLDYKNQRSEQKHH